jgi:uncharacterized membrane protein YagU involved in acid resistance
VAAGAETWSLPVVAGLSSEYFGELVWFDGYHRLRTPLVVRFTRN